MFNNIVFKVSLLANFFLLKIEYIQNSSYWWIVIIRYNIDVATKGVNYD